MSGAGDVVSGADVVPEAGIVPGVVVTSDADAVLGAGVVPDAGAVSDTDVVSGTERVRPGSVGVPDEVSIGSPSSYLKVRLSVQLRSDRTYTAELTCRLHSRIIAMMLRTPEKRSSRGCALLY